MIKKKSVIQHLYKNKLTEKHAFLNFETMFITTYKKYLTENHASLNFETFHLNL